MSCSGHYGLYLSIFWMLSYQHASLYSQQHQHQHQHHPHCWSLHPPPPPPPPPCPHFPKKTSNTLSSSLGRTPWHTLCVRFSGLGDGLLFYGACLWASRVPTRVYMCRKAGERRDESRRREKERERERESVCVMYMQYTGRMFIKYDTFVDTCSQASNHSTHTHTHTHTYNQQREKYLCLPRT